MKFKRGFTIYELKEWMHGQSLMIDKVTKNQQKCSLESLAFYN